MIVFPAIDLKGGVCVRLIFRMAKMTVVTRMVATEPTSALKRMTTPVVLVNFPKPNGNATVT